jgi:hypothetical protein
VQSAFLGLLRRYGRRVPSDWVSNGWHRQYGVGIVDAVGLIQAGLPDVPETAVPETAQSGTQEPVARIQAALADLDDEQVRAVIGDLLGVDGRHVDALRPVVVSELVYRLGEDDQFRDSVLSQAFGPERPPAPGPDARSLLDRTASAALRGAIRR